MLTRESPNKPIHSWQSRDASGNGQRACGSARNQIQVVRLPAVSTDTEIAISSTPRPSAEPQLPRVPRTPWKKKQPVATKASGLRAATVRRHAAETALREAANYRDVNRLTSCIEAAVSLGVSPILIKEAEQVLISCHRIAAEVALRRAIENERPDVHTLASCIKTARNCGVSKVLVGDAEDLLPKVQEAARQRRAAEIALAMCRSLSSKDPDQISACIEAAREAGVAAAMVDNAENTLLQLRHDQETSKQKRAAESAVAMCRALGSKNPAEISARIAAAREAGVVRIVDQADEEKMLLQLRKDLAKQAPNQTANSKPDSRAEFCAIDRSQAGQGSAEVNVGEEDMLQSEIEVLRFENKALRRKLELSALKAALQFENDALKRQLEKSSSGGADGTNGTGPSVVPNHCAERAHQVVSSPKCRRVSDIFTEPGQTGQSLAKAHRTPAVIQTAVSSAIAQQEMSETMRERASFQRNARRKLAQSYLQGCIAPAVLPTLSRRPDFIALRNKTHDLVTEAVQNGRLDAALRVAFGSHDDEGA